MNDTLRKDFVSLNRNYLFLVRVLAKQDQCAEMLTGMSSTTLELIRNCSIEEIEAIAESMPTLCFRLKDCELAAAINLNDEKRRAYLTTISVNQGQGKKC